MLDEPFAGLSAASQEGITNLIKRLHDDGVTIFVTGHVLRELMNLVPRVIAMHQGKLIDDGPPKEIVKNKIVLEAYLGKGVEIA